MPRPIRPPATCPRPGIAHASTQVTSTLMESAAEADSGVPLSVAGGGSGVGVWAEKSGPFISLITGSEEEKGLGVLSPT